MNTILPEGRTQTAGETVTTPLSADDQIAILHKILAGNRAFGKCRGNFDEFPYEKFLFEEEVPISPSAVLKKCSKWLGTHRIMLNTLALLKRNGLDIAYGELEKALCNPDYVITGETIPVEKTESGVLVMLDPQKTLLLVRWMYTSRWEDLNGWVVNGKIPEESGPCGSLTPQLLEAFPELRNKYKWNYERRPESPTYILEPKIGKIYKLFRDNFSSGNVHCMFVDQWRSACWYGNYTVGIFISDTTQDKVLSLFPRDEQGSISTWRFEYPKATCRSMKSVGSSSLWIGLHPEAEHEKWSHLWPSYVSKGCTSGYGAIIVDQEKIGKVSFTPSPFPAYETFDGPYPNQCLGDISARRLVIGFPYESNY